VGVVMALESGPGAHIGAPHATKTTLPKLDRGRWTSKLICSVSIHELNRSRNFGRLYRRVPFDVHFLFLSTPSFTFPILFEAFKI
jgi:hypothetical protein